ncbi:MAG: hypothetical protein WKF88_10440 [Ferruginibacter sp.]
MNIGPCVPPALTTQPQNASISCGGTATFTVATSGTASTFTWQFRPTASGVWTDVPALAPYSGQNTATLTITNAPITLNGYQYRAIFTNPCGGPDASNAATLTVNPLSISITPTTANYCTGSGTPVLITVPNSSNTLQFTNTASATIPDGVLAGLTKTFTVTGVTGTVTGARLILNVTHPYVSDVIVALKAPNGNVLNLDYGVSGTFVANTANLVNTTFTSAAGAPLMSSAPAPYTGSFRPDARLVPINPGIPTGPTGFAANVNTFAQLFSTPNGTWTLAMYDYGTPDVGTFNNATLELTFGAAPATGVFSPLTDLFTDAAGTIPDTGTAVSHVYAAPAATTTYTGVVSTATCAAGSSTTTITVNTVAGGTPTVANAGGCTNGNTSFTVTGLTGGPNFTYVWEVSTDGGTSYTTVTNGGGVSGATTATLTIANPTASMAGNLYRVKVTGAGCAGTTTLTSNAATLTTVSAPVVVTSVAPTTSVMPGTTTTLTAAVSGTNGTVTYQWFRNGVAVPGATSNMLVVGVDGLGTYTVRVSDANGCSAVSSTPLEISISAAASNNFFIYPSPNNGVFQVRYYNATATATSTDAAMINVFDAKGTRVYTQRYALTGPYTQMNVNMGTHGGGVYTVELSDSRGDRLKTGSVIVY